MGKRGLDPKAVAEWQRIIRDVTITITATFMLVFETVYRENPNAYVLGAGLAMLGVPPALRLDQVRRRNGRSGSPPSGEQPSPEIPSGDDPYAGPGGYYRT